MTLKKNSPETPEAAGVPIIRSVRELPPGFVEVARCYNNADSLAVRASILRGDLSPKDHARILRTDGQVRTFLYVDMAAADEVLAAAQRRREEKAAKPTQDTAASASVEESVRRMLGDREVLAKDHIMEAVDACMRPYERKLEALEALVRQVAGKLDRLIDASGAVRNGKAGQWPLMPPGPSLSEREDLRG